MIASVWPDLHVFARDAGAVDPHAAPDAARFRGEEAFGPAVEGWRRWSKPSPEPCLDEAFDALLLRSIAREGPWIAAAVEGLAARLAEASREPPVLVAILRAGVPVAALLARALERRLGAPVPVAALSLFDGLGFDAAALQAVLARWPGRPVWFVDGWTSRGGVARELAAAHGRWLAAGRPDYTEGVGPRLAVLCDPPGLAHAAATRADRFVPSACFTAPCTLGFSRGFADATGGLFGVYTFPPRLARPALVRAWLDLATLRPAPVVDEAAPRPFEAPPPGWRIHVNEVVRALINRAPGEVRLLAGREAAGETLAPVLRLCALRGVPVSFGCAEVAAWGATAAARLSGAAP